jgi:hypothetical protein
MGVSPGFHGENPVTNRLSYGIAEELTVRIMELLSEIKRKTKYFVTLVGC